MKQIALVVLGWLVLLICNVQGADETQPSGSSPCDLLSNYLHSGETLPGDRSLSTVIAQKPGSNLRLDTDVGNGWSLESIVRGSLHCQSPTLYHTTSSGREKISIPHRFEGEEGSHCQGDVVRLASLNEIPALLEDAVWGGNSIDKTVIHLATRTNTGWTPICSITVLATRHYAVTDKFCNGNYCDALAGIASKLSDLRHAKEGGAYLPSEQNLRGADRGAFNNMVRLAEEQGIEKDFEIPTLGQKNEHSSYADHSFVGWVTKLVPIVFGGQVFLAKIGTAGFGNHFGSADVLAIYELVGDHLNPVAGFCLNVTSKMISKVDVSNSPEAEIE